MSVARVPVPVFASFASTNQNSPSKSVTHESQIVSDTVLDSAVKAPRSYNPKPKL